MKPLGAEVRLLHVIEPFPVELARTMGSPAFPDFDAARLERRQEAERFLEQSAAMLRAAGFSVTSVVHEGDPRTDILDEADAWRRIWL